MAERSTAAVDVADNSGDEPLTAKAGQSTADGVARTGETGEQNTTDTDAENTGTAGGAEKTAPPELHSGHKLARRYRLEECVTRLDGFSSWRAVDEKLRRATGVHILPADHPRARSVLAASRSSALLGDPRFVHVLDAVEENDLVYVVHEWLPDATELTALLAAGPLEVHHAYEMVDQVAQAMAAAHREGLAHLRLTPSAVLRTASGQWRIRGLAVNAALRGITSQTPQRTDTEAIGALLYASLTQRWPYENDAHGLRGLPKGVGLISPIRCAPECTAVSPSSPCVPLSTREPPLPGRSRRAPHRRIWRGPSVRCRVSVRRSPRSPIRRNTSGPPTSRARTVSPPVPLPVPRPISRFLRRRSTAAPGRPSSGPSPRC